MKKQFTVFFRHYLALFLCYGTFIGLIQAQTPRALGTSGNAYSQAFSAKSYLYADPYSGAIVHTHRSNLPNSNNIEYDYSFNKGITWTNNQSAYITNSTTGSARYPEGVLFNPNHAVTSPSLLPYVFVSPVLAGTNGLWGSLLGGVKYMGNNTANTTLLNSNSPNTFHLIPDVTWTSPDAIYSIEVEQRDIAGTFTYTGSLLLTKYAVTTGVSPTISATRTEIPFPATRATDVRIAFSPDGQTGYITILGKNNDLISNPDISSNVHVFKTTNAGVTWVQAADHVINLTRDANLKSFRDKVFADSVEFNFSGSIDTKVTYGPGFHHDITVDRRGNLHLLVEVAVTGYAGTSSAPISQNVYTGRNLRAMSHIWTEDGGSSWNADTLGRRYTFREQVGSSICNNGLNGGDGRPQIAMDTTGTTIFFAWFDTDTTLFNLDCNNLPSFILAGAKINGSTGNVVSRLPVRSMSQGTGLDGFFTFGNISSQYVFSGTGNYEIPVSYTSLSNANDALSFVNYFYVSGYTINDVDFVALPVTNPTNLTIWNGSSWSNGVPDNTKRAIIDGNYTTSGNGNIQAKILTVNLGKTLSVNTGGVITADSLLVNNGSIVNCGGFVVAIVVGNFITIGSPINITGQPADQTVVSGQPATFNVSATGSIANYQWIENSSTPVGSSATYTIPFAGVTQNGNTYRVEITGGCGSITSAQATLTVHPDTTIWTGTNWTNGPPTASTLAVISGNYNSQLHGSIFAYSIVVMPSDTLFVLSGSLYTVNASNGIVNNGQIYSCNNNLTGTVTGTLVNNAAIPVITSSPVNQTVNVGQAASFSATATGLNIQYDWVRNNLNIVGANSQTYTTPPAILANNGDLYQMKATNVCGTITSSSALLTVIPVTVWNGTTWSNGVPTSNYEAVIDGNYNTMTNSSISALRIIVNAADTLVITSGMSVTAANTLVNNGHIINCGGSLLGVLSGNTVSAALPPSVSVPPADQTVTAGQAAIFTASVSNVGGQYSWLKNNVAIPGTNTTFYNIPTTTIADNGSTYSIRATNVCGIVTSPAALLTVNPISTTWNGNVWSNGTPNLSYRAILNGDYNTQTHGNLLAREIVINAIATLKIISSDSVNAFVSINNNGSIIDCGGVIVGSLSGNNPVLATPPAILTQPVDQSVQEPQPATFSTAATGSGLAYEWITSGTVVGTASSYTTSATSLADNGKMFTVKVLGTCGDIFSDTVTLFVSPISSLAYINGSSRDIQIYPNPVSNWFDILGGEAGDEYNLLSSTGQVVRSGEIADKRHRIETQDLAAGVYILRITMSDATFSHKIVIK